MSLGDLNKYQFRIHHDPSGEPAQTHVLAWGDDESTPVGAMSIIHAGESQAWEQKAMNDWNEPHGTAPDPSRGWRNGVQQRWTGGNMDPHDPSDVTHVAWLHAQNPAVLKGLIATAAVFHGRMPHSDKTLTEEGARISQRMHDRIGLPPHPDNPKMTATEGRMNPVMASTVSRTLVNRLVHWGDGVPGVDVPSEEVAQNTGAVFAKPPWSRKREPPKNEQLRLL